MPVCVKPRHIRFRNRQNLLALVGQQHASFLKQLLVAAMQQRFAAERVPPALLARFGAVYVGDSTIIALPPALATAARMTRLISVQCQAMRWN